MTPMQQLNAIRDGLAQLQLRFSGANTRMVTLDNMMVSLKTTLTSQLQDILTQYIGAVEAVNLLPVKLAELKLHLAGIVTVNANHVVVYALAYDKDGFYCAPSDALMAELFDYLEERRLINTTHEVMAASEVLQKCTIDTKIRIKKTVVVERVTESVRLALTNLLRARIFGVSLYISDVYQALQGIDGILSINAEIAFNNGQLYIEGEQSGLDDHGNLVLAKQEHIISKADVDIVTAFPVTVL